MGNAKSASGPERNACKYSWTNLNYCTDEENIVQSCEIYFRFQ